MPDRVRWGILGNAHIGRTCVIPAMQKSRNCAVLQPGNQESRCCIGSLQAARYRERR